MKKEFGRPKSQLQLEIGFKEIMMRPGEMPWELDQRLKYNILEANTNLTDSHHRNWIIAALLPHLRTSLSQKKIGTHVEALEIMMRFRETLIQDGSFGVQHIHSKLQNRCLELQILKKEKPARPEVCEEVWCFKCKK